MMVFSGKRGFYVGLLIAIIIAFAHLWLSYSLASHPNLNGMITYVSDEVWYVDSARNLLREVFGVQPICVNDSGYAFYTIVFKDKSSMQKAYPTLKALIEAAKGEIIRKYEKSPLIAIAIPEGVDPNSLVREIQGVEFIQSGYPFGYAEGIHRYMNYEHPPLMKYFIGASMLLLGDWPLNWRIPSLLMGFAIVIIVYIIGYRLGGALVGLAASLFSLVDPILRNMSAIAMLDIGLAFFGALSLLMACERRYILSAIMVGLAATVKMSGAFLIPALYLAMRLDGERIDKALIVSLYIPLTVWVILNLPLIAHLGIIGWLSQIEGALRWHTSSRPAGGPPVSLPWEWLYNAHPFYMSYDPGMAATVNPALYIIGFLATIPMVYMASKNRERAYPSVWLWAVFIGYILVVVAGNHTLYSFYAVFLAPFVYLQTGALLEWLNVSKLLSELVTWYKELVVKILKGEAPIPAEVKIILSLLKSSGLSLSILGTALLMLTYSYFLHLPQPYTPWSHYSDIVGAYSIIKPGLPYKSYDPGQYPLPALIAHIAWTIFGQRTAGILPFYTFNAVVLAIAGLCSLIDMGWLMLRAGVDEKRAYIYAASLTLLVYGIYSWELITLALILKALRWQLEGSVIKGSVLLGLAIASNPYAIAILIAILLVGERSRSIKTIVASIASFALLIIPLILLTSPGDALRPYIVFISGRLEGSILIYLLGGAPDNPYGFLAFIIIASIIIVGLARYIIQRTNISGNDLPFLAFITLGAMLSVGHIFKPQYFLLALPLLAVASRIGDFSIRIADILNALVITFWWSYTEWGAILFKYTPWGPLDPFALTTLCSAGRDVLLLYLVIRSTLLFVEKKQG